MKKHVWRTIVALAFALTLVAGLASAAVDNIWSTPLPDPAGNSPAPDDNMRNYICSTSGMWTVWQDKRTTSDSYSRIFGYDVHFDIPLNSPLYPTDNDASGQNWWPEWLERKALWPGQHLSTRPGAWELTPDDGHNRYYPAICDDVVVYEYYNGTDMDIRWTTASQTPGAENILSVLHPAYNQFKPRVAKYSGTYRVAWYDTYDYKVHYRPLTNGTDTPINSHLPQSYTDFDLGTRYGVLFDGTSLWKFDATNQFGTCWQLSLPPCQDITWPVTDGTYAAFIADVTTGQGYAIHQVWAVNLATNALTMLNTEQDLPEAQRTYAIDTQCRLAIASGMVAWRSHGTKGVANQVHNVSVMDVGICSVDGGESPPLHKFLDREWVAFADGLQQGSWRSFSLSVNQDAAWDTSEDKPNADFIMTNLPERVPLVMGYTYPAKIFLRNIPTSATPSAWTSSDWLTPLSDATDGPSTYDAYTAHQDLHSVVNGKPVGWYLYTDVQNSVPVWGLPSLAVPTTDPWEVATLSFTLTPPPWAGRWAFDFCVDDGRSLMFPDSSGFEWRPNNDTDLLKVRQDLWFETFYDVIAPDVCDYWSEIEACAYAGLLDNLLDPDTGVVDPDPAGHGFHPYDIADRAILAVLTYNAEVWAGVTPLGYVYTGAQLFTDVPPGYWAYNQISWCKLNGLVSGYNNGDGTYSYHPAEQVSRATATIYISRASEDEVPVFNPDPAPNTYTPASYYWHDVPSSYWADNWVYWMSDRRHLKEAYNWIDNNSLFYPDTLINRAEMCRLFTWGYDLWRPPKNATPY